MTWTVHIGSRHMNTLIYMEKPLSAGQPVCKTGILMISHTTALHLNNVQTNTNNEDPVPNHTLCIAL